MSLRAIIKASAAVLVLCAAGAVQAQAPNKPPSSLTENELKEVLVWNSPWEGRGATPTRPYSYRTTFRARRDTLLAEVLSYSTNQRADSVVTVQNGHLTWQDSNGADVSVSLADAGDLVGTASSRGTELPIVLKPRK